jgi:hypothetical protein
VNIPITIQISDEASQAIRIKIAKADPHKVATRAAVPLARHWRDSLAKLPQNKRGYPSTGFWEQAARSVRSVVLAESQGGYILLTADKLGLKKRLYGGSTKAVKHKNVTVPICAEANGTKVSDWGMENLVLVILGDGRKFLALWLGSTAVQKKYKAGESKKLTKWKKRKAAAEEAQLAGGGPKRFGVHGSEQFTTEARSIRGFTDKEGNVHAGLNDISKKPKVIVFKNPGTGAKDMAHASRHANLKFLFRLMPETGEAAPMPQVIPADMADVAMKAVKEAIQ